MNRLEASTAPASDAQRQSPYLDALEAHAAMDPDRLNVPTHKGGKRAPERLIRAIGVQALRLDIPPLIPGIDLGVPPTALQSAQQLAAEAWQAQRSWFLLNGASQGNHAACLALALRGPEVIVQRNVHSSVVAGIVLAGLRPTFVAPELDRSRGIAHCVTPANLLRALERVPAATGVIVSSPSYYGMAADVSALVELAHAHEIPIVVDEAWGAHFAFHDRLPLDAVSAGADLVVSSTHKMLGSMTQSAMLHLGPNHRFNAELVNQCVTMLESTSPSSVLIASLDAARQRASVDGRRLIEETLRAVHEIRSRIREIPGLEILDDRLVGTMGISDIDPFRLAIDVRASGISGYELQRQLRDTPDVHIELATETVLVAICGMGMRPADGDRLLGALGSALQPSEHVLRRTGGNGSECSEAAAIVPPMWGQLAMTPRHAFLAPSRNIPVDQAAGQVSAESLAVYPPGIPNVLLGEVLSDEIVAYLSDMHRRGAVIRGASDPRLATLRVVAES